jgi:hypothetical protein
VSDSELEPTKWKIFGERLVDENPFIRLSIASVGLTDGTEFEQYVIRMRCTATTAVVDDHGWILLRPLQPNPPGQARCALAGPTAIMPRRQARRLPYPRRAIPVTSHVRPRALPNKATMTRTKARCSAAL